MNLPCCRDASYGLAIAAQRMLGEVLLAELLPPPAIGHVASVLLRWSSGIYLGCAWASSLYHGTATRADTLRGKGHHAVSVSLMIRSSTLAPSYGNRLSIAASSMK